MVQVGLQIAVLLWATRKLAQPPITLRTDDAFHKHIHDYTCDCCMICLADIIISYIACLPWITGE